MNTQESMVRKGYTQAAIERLKEYLLTTSESNADLELSDDMLFVKFKNENGPAPELIQMARQIFFQTDKFCIPDIDGFVHYYSASNIMMVNLVHYEEINAICEKLTSFGADVKGFDLRFHEYTFTYDVPGRGNLIYHELLEIEQIVEPKEVESLDHISVFRTGKSYTLTIKHNSWKI